MSILFSSVQKSTKKNYCKVQTYNRLFIKQKLSYIVKKYTCTVPSTSVNLLSCFTSPTGDSCHLLILNYQKWKHSQSVYITKGNKEYKLQNKVIHTAIMKHHQISTLGIRMHIMCLTQHVESSIGQNGKAQSAVETTPCFPLPVPFMGYRVK